MLQAYGPHIDYLARVLRDAGLSLKDVKLRWVKDLTGTNQSPRAALREPGIDAAMLIIPDALALTSGGKVGTGAEESVRGAKILLSTKTANRVIADFYAVRADYLAANRAARGERWCGRCSPRTSSLRRCSRRKAATIPATAP